MQERRQNNRKSVDLFLNKYIDGYPYLCHAVNLSEEGILVERTLEPNHHAASYAVELGIPNVEETIWVWTQPVWTNDKQQALRFVGLDAADEVRLQNYLGSLS